MLQPVVTHSRRRDGGMCGPPWWWWDDGNSSTVLLSLLLGHTSTCFSDSYTCSFSAAPSPSLTGGLSFTAKSFALHRSKPGSPWPGRGGRRERRRTSPDQINATVSTSDKSCLWLSPLGPKRLALPHLLSCVCKQQGWARGEGSMSDWCHSQEWERPNYISYPSRAGKPLW